MVRERLTHTQADDATCKQKLTVPYTLQLTGLQPGAAPNPRALRLYILQAGVRFGVRGTVRGGGLAAPGSVGAGRGLGLGIGDRSGFSV